jgi:hypothetical protein
MFMFVLVHPIGQIQHPLRHQLITSNPKDKTIQVVERVLTQVFENERRSFVNIK